MSLIDLNVPEFATPKECKTKLEIVQEIQGKEFARQKLAARVIGEIMFVQLLETIQSKDVKIGDSILLHLPKNVNACSERMLAILQKFPEVNLEKDQSLIKNNDEPFSHIYLDVFKFKDNYPTVNLYYDGNIETKW